MPDVSIVRVVFALSLAACAASRAAHATVYCVGSATELANALASAENNGLDDEIRLRAGVYYSTAQPTGGFHATVDDARGFDVSGGWIDAGCTVHRDEPGLSVIDGNHANGAMTLFATKASNIPVRLAWLTFRNGAGYKGYGLNLGSLDYVKMPIVVENCVFRDNRNYDGYIGLGALSFVGDGRLVLRNSLFTGNRGSEASSVYNQGGTHPEVSVPALVNNTFTGNETLTNSTTVVNYGTMTFENNIIWGNIKPSPDMIDFYGYTARILRNNDIEHLDLSTGGGPGPGSGGNVSVDPGFVGPVDFRLRSDSPLRNAGILAPAGGFGQKDLDGAPRILDDEVDVGAYEVDRLFADGFDGSP
ncbi:MAG: hypothetical protein RL684_2590 [Pseudomonadota bacterium]|jgi:hypothetical protein